MDTSEWVCTERNAFDRGCALVFLSLAPSSGELDTAGVQQRRLSDMVVA